MITSSLGGNKIGEKQNIECFKMFVLSILSGLSSLNVHSEQPHVVSSGQPRSEAAPHLHPAKQSNYLTELTDSVGAGIRESVGHYQYYFTNIY